MLDFLIDNILVTFRGAIFQQQFGIPMGTNFASLLAILFLYSYKTEFLQVLNPLIINVLSINNPCFGKSSPSIYPSELKKKETTEIAYPASFWNIHLEFNNSGRLGTKIYDKRDDFNLKL